MKEPKTRLSGKEYSPLVIRRYSTPVLHWVAIITDDNLDDLDAKVTNLWEELDPLPVSIQDWRNVAGRFCDSISKDYQKVEGLAIVIAADKMLVSSLFGDFMNHLGCRLELFTMLIVSNQV